jgi:chromosome segregation ATPase
MAGSEFPPYPNYIEPLEELREELASTKRQLANAHKRSEDWKCDLDKVVRAIYPDKVERFTYCVDFAVDEVKKLRHRADDLEAQLKTEQHNCKVLLDWQTELARELDAVRRILAFLSDPDTSIRRLPNGRHQISHPNLQQLHVGTLCETIVRAAQLWSKSNA